MKKILCMILAFTLSSSFLVGCSDDNQSSTASSGSSQTSQSSDSTETSSPSDPTPEDTLPEGSATDSMLSEALSAQMQETASMKVNLELHNSLLSLGNYYETDGDGNPTTTPAMDIYYDENKISVEAVFSVGTDDKLDAKIEILGEETYAEGIEFETYIETTVYIIDNTVYTWNKNIEAWIKEANLSQTVTQIAETVRVIEDSNLFTQADKSKLFADLGEFINVAFDVKEFKGTLTFDGKDAANDFFTYFEELDTQTKTLSALLDDGLKLIDKELTTAKLLAKVKEVASLTVNEAVAEIDAWLTENHQTTLQGVYDRLVSSDSLINFALDKAGVAPEAKAEKIANLKAFKISDRITEMGIGDVPLYDVLMSLDADGEEYATIDEFFTQIEGTLALTVTQFEESVNFPPFISLLKQESPYFTVNALDGKMDIKFTNTFSIESIYGEFNIDVENVSPSEVEGENDITALKWKAEMEISEISKDALTIAIPTEDAVYDFYADGDYESFEDGFYALSIETYENEAYFEVWGTLPSGIDVSLEAMIPTSSLTSPTIEVAPENIEVYVDYQLYDIALDKSIIVEIVGEEFIIKQFPDLGLAEHHAYHALYSIQDGKTDYTLDPDLGISVEMWPGSSSGSISYANPCPINVIIFEAERNYVTGEMVCTITGYNTDGYLVDVETGIEYIGSIPEQIPTLFGGDVEFTFYVTEDGIITCDDIPAVLPEYIK